MRQARVCEVKQACQFLRILQTPQEASQSFPSACTSLLTHLGGLALSFKLWNPSEPFFAANALVHSGPRSFGNQLSTSARVSLTASSSEA